MMWNSEHRRSIPSRRRRSPEEADRRLK
jgi:hypothetical protein